MTVKTNQPTKVPALPSVPQAGISPELATYLRNLNDAVDIRLGRKGDARDRAVTLRELIEGGIVLEANSGAFNTNIINGRTVGMGPTTAPELPIRPTQAAGLNVAPLYSQLYLTWDSPTYLGHLFTEIYRHTADVLGDAEFLTYAVGAAYVDPVGGGQTFYYWIRHVSNTGNVGQWNAAAGTVGTTPTDVSVLLSRLNGALRESELAASLTSRIDLIDASGSVNGSVAQRIAAEATARTGAVTGLQDQINTLSAVADWDSTIAYSNNDLAVYSGNLYKALASSTNVQPDTDDTKWQDLGAYSSLAEVVAANEAAITQLNTVTSGSTSANALALTSVIATTGTNTGAINELNNVSADSTSATALRMFELQAIVDAIDAPQWAHESISTSYAVGDVVISGLNNSAVWSYGANIPAALDIIYDPTQRAIEIPKLPGGDVATGITFDAFDIGDADSFTISFDVRGDEDKSGGLFARVYGGSRANVGNHAYVSYSLDADNTLVYQAVSSDTLPITGLSYASATGTVEDEEIFAAWTNCSFTVTPSSGKEDWLYSLSVLNWSGNASNSLYLRNIKITENLASGATGRSWDYSSRARKCVAAHSAKSLSDSDYWEDIGSARSALETSRVQGDIKSLNDISAASDSVNARAIKQVSAMLGGSGSTIEQLLSSTASADGLNAQYTLKIDSNGAVSGFGLSSLTNTAGDNTTEFIINADKFQVIAPNASDLNNAETFFSVVTSDVYEQDEFGNSTGVVSVPAGVYMADGFIKNASITGAKIGNAAIDSAQIADASINSAKIGHTIQSENWNDVTKSGWRISKANDTIEAGGINIWDAEGNVILASDTTEAQIRNGSQKWSDVSGTGRPADDATRNVFRGAYNSSTTYAINDMVVYSGQVYICIQGGSGNAPSGTTASTGYWSIFSERGEQGEAGTAARSVSLSAPTQAVTYTAAGVTPNPSNSFTVTATALNTTGTSYYEFKLNGVSSGVTTSATYSYTPPNNYSSLPSVITVDLREGSTTSPILASDTFTIFGIKPGEDGSAGAAGTSAAQLVDRAQGSRGATRADISYDASENALSLQSDSDSNFGVVFPPFAVQANETYKIKFSYKTTVSTSSGLYVRIIQDDELLPAGKLYIETRSTESQAADVKDVGYNGAGVPGYVSVFSNRGVPDTWATEEYIYVVPANAVNAGIQFLNWDGLGFRPLLIKNLEVIKEAEAALTVVLSNEAHTVPASNAGVVSSYAGSGTVIRVYEGVNELDYDGTGTNASGWTVAKTATGITAGTQTGQGNVDYSVVIGNHSNMTADVATVNYTITGKRASGVAFEVTRTQTLTKSKEGAQGSPGSSVSINGTSYDATTGVTTVTFNDTNGSITITDGQDGTNGQPGQPGQPGTSAGVKVVYASYSSGTDKSFTQGTRQFVKYHEYTGAAPSLDDIPATGFVRFIGEDGSTPTNSGVIPIYANNATGSGKSLVQGARTFVNFYEWTGSVPTGAPNGLTYVKFEGTDGANGEDGTDGEDGTNGADGALGGGLDFGFTNTEIDATGAVSKTTTSANYDASIYTNNAYTSGCFLTFKTLTNDVSYMVALNDNPSSSSYFSTLDYAWWLSKNGVIQAYESNVGKALDSGQPNTYAVGDIFSITYDNDKVRYLHNGVVKRTVAANTDRTFHFDSTLQQNSSGASIQGVKVFTNIAFAPQGQVGVNQSTIIGTDVDWVADAPMPLVLGDWKRQINWQETASIIEPPINGGPFGDSSNFFLRLSGRGTTQPIGWQARAAYYFSNNKNSTYWFTCFVKRRSNDNSASDKLKAGFYSGLTTTAEGANRVIRVDYNTDDNDGNPQNPYFTPNFGINDFPDTNDWYLVVGVVHPHNYAGEPSGISGVYDLETGAKVPGQTSSTEWKWVDSYTKNDNYWRLGFYTTSTSYGASTQQTIINAPTDRGYFIVRPSIYITDGTQPDLQSIMNNNQVAITPQNIGTYIQDLSVDTLHIADNSIFVPRLIEYAGSSGSSANLNAGSWRELDVLGSTETLDFSNTMTSTSILIYASWDYSFHHYNTNAGPKGATSGSSWGDFRIQILVEDFYAGTWTLRTSIDLFNALPGYFGGTYATASNPHNTNADRWVAFSLADTVNRGAVRFRTVSSIYVTGWQVNSGAYGGSIDVDRTWREGRVLLMGGKK